MPESLQDLLNQKQALEREISRVREKEVNEAVTLIKSLVMDFGLTPADIFGGEKKKSKGESKVAAKYRDPATGSTWTGRGKEPKWIQGQDRNQFMIN